MFTPDQPAEYIARQVRAYEPWPGSFFHWDSKVNNKPAICMREGVLVLDEIQISGKKALPGEVFLRGARDFVGYKLDFEKIVDE